MLSSISYYYISLRFYIEFNGGELTVQNSFAHTTNQNISN